MKDAELINNLGRCIYVSDGVKTRKLILHATASDCIWCLMGSVCGCAGCTHGKMSAKDLITGCTHGKMSAKEIITGIVKSSAEDKSFTLLLTLKNAD